MLKKEDTHVRVKITSFYFVSKDRKPFLILHICCLHPFFGKLYMTKHHVHLASFKSESLLFIGDICSTATPLPPRVWCYLLYYFCCNHLKFCFLRNPVSQYLNWLYLIILKYPSVVTCLLCLWLFSLKLHI